MYKWPAKFYPIPDISILELSEIMSPYDRYLTEANSILMGINYETTVTYSIMPGNTNTENTPIFAELIIRDMESTFHLIFRNTVAAAPTEYPKI